MKRLLQSILSLISWLVLLISTKEIPMVQSIPTPVNLHETADICQDNLPTSNCQELMETRTCEDTEVMTSCPKSCNLCEENLQESRAEGGSCQDKYANCTSVSNSVTCCDWYNTLPVVQFPCKKTCGICGNDGVFQPKPNNQRKKPSGQSSYPSFVDIWCRPDYSKPIENQPGGSSVISQIQG